MRIEEVRSNLCARLRGRRSELVESALTRVKAVSSPREPHDPRYVDGLRTAVGAAIEYGIDTLERSEDRAPPIPTALLSQARLAARSGVPLDAVLRRYFAGYTLFSDFVIDDAERAGTSPGGSLKQLMRVQAALFDRLIAAVIAEYNRESARPTSSAERKAERIERLLAGERINAAELAYDLEGWHLCLVAFGPGAKEAIGAIAMKIGARVLAIPREEGFLWAWLGSRRRLDPEALRATAAPRMPAGLSFAIGEPGAGIVGWRLSHRQAVAAQSVALRSGESLVRYADVALLAAAMHDDLLAASLRRLYIEPLEQERDGGTAVREALRAYFSSACNVSSAAASLGVARQTVAKRLRAAEERIGCPIVTHGTEVEVALRLQEIGLHRTPESETTPQPQTGSPR